MAKEYFGPNSLEELSKLLNNDLASINTGDGYDGADGKDGYSPTVTIENIDGGHRVTVTDVDGPKSFDVMDGKDGAGWSGDPCENGKDGFSPVVTVSEIDGGHRIIITDADGSQSIDILDGKNGTDGYDGFSPNVTVTEIEGGHKITITDINGPHVFNVMDGKDGVDGTSPTIEITDIDGGHRVTITDANGDKSFDVLNGKDGDNAYELAVKDGFEGTITNWLASLKGKDGLDYLIANVSSNGPPQTPVMTISKASFSRKPVYGDAFIVLYKDTSVNHLYIGKGSVVGIPDNIDQDYNIWQVLIGTTLQLMQDITGSSGLTPYIGQNGNWWIGEEDTGIQANGKDGSDGTDGSDGYSPIINVNKIEGGHQVSITDVNDTKTFDVMDGKSVPMTPIEGDIPIKPIIKEEYDSLSEEEKNSDVGWLITDLGETISEDDLEGLTIGHGLRITDNILSVEATNDFSGDNTLPMTAAGVLEQIGNIEALLNVI